MKNPRSILITSIAIACHQANKSWCEQNGDSSQKDFHEAEEWQQESALKGVEFRLNNPNAGPDAQHNTWMEDKLKEGWVYGIEKDAEKKTHPCLVPFSELPEFQQKKDKLFVAIVDALSTPTITELTFGQKAVGASFNPSFMPEVDKVKMLFGETIDIMEAKHKKECEVLGASWERNVLRTESWNAVVRASAAVVKYLTWKD